MRGFRNALALGLLAAMPVLAQGQGQRRVEPPATAEGSTATPAKPAGSITPATDPAAIGRNVLNAGPDPRVRQDGLSLDHAAIFGTDDEGEQAVLDNERALQAQRDQLQVLERLLTQKPAAVDPYPPAMIPLNNGAPMNMAPLAPTPSGSQLGGAPPSAAWTRCSVGLMICGATPTRCGRADARRSVRVAMRRAVRLNPPVNPPRLSGGQPRRASSRKRPAIPVGK